MSLNSMDQSEWLQKIATWLGRKDYTQAELKHRLEQAGLSSDQYNPLLHRAQELGWLSDERVAQSTLERKRTQWGKQRLQYHLKQRGIDPVQIENLTAELNEESEQQRAFTLWEKKFKGSLPQTPQEKQRQIRFLVTRGFEMRVIQNVFSRAKQQEYE